MRPTRRSAKYVGFARQGEAGPGALTEVGARKDDIVGGVKVMTYFNLHIRTVFPNHLRELRELHHLSACIDLLRSGDIARVGDALSARLMAIHQSMVDASWRMAKHMEIYPMEDNSAAGAATILATRKHAKLIEKVQGGNTQGWGNTGIGRGGRWRNEWPAGEGGSENRNKGKGKGKNKKGKGKGWTQGGKGEKTSWEAAKEKAEEKPRI